MMVEEIKETVKRSYNIKNLYLDPNNYRFVDDDDYKLINDSELLLEKVQRKTKGFIEGDKRENIKDLISSFKANGFIDVDVIQVRDLGSNNYLVLEGNRRVTTLKALQEDYENGKDIGNLNPEIFKKIPFEIHNNEHKEMHLIVMGLKHISGNKKWSAINQAQLIYDFLKPYFDTDEYWGKEVQLHESLGITKVKLRTTQRAYHLILAYKRSDYGDQFKSNDYSIFEEISKRPSIKEWIGWDDNSYLATNYNNLQRLFSWISKTEELDEDEGENKEIEPIISKSVEIRDLALFIKNENALSIMEDKRSVSRALLASGEIERKEYDNVLSDLKNNIEKLSTLKAFVSSEDREILSKLQKDFDDVMPQKSSLEMLRGNVSVCFEFTNNKHFNSIRVNNYKIFSGFKIEKLNRINIFAGKNNSGKSSLLEAIYYLTKQNDIVSFLENIKLRNKLHSLDPIWLNAVFDQNDIIDIEGEFDTVSTSVRFTKFDADSNIDKKDDYLASYKLEAKINKRELTNIIHTFESETVKRENEKVEHLCNSILKSPYYYNFQEIVTTYTINNKEKINGKEVLSMVIDFISSIDPTIYNISLGSIEEVQRFIVHSSKFSDRNLEITNYGEGLQRIFEIAIAFAYARNGVVCIDEFETAIHYSLLVDFTRFIQQLADTFNVQVFLTSHSKECIDAFVDNGYKNDDISAYLLENINGEIKTKFTSGERLKYLSENISLDIRGSQNG